MTEGFATFQANQLSFSRGNRKIWDKATWAMQGPSAILGANGSGKSSTLALLAGQVAPDQGELCFTSEGTPLDSEQWMTAISLAAPWVELPNHLTMEETLTFHGMFRSPRTGNMGWASLLSTSGLNVAPDVPMALWSSGQRQRLSLALALGTQTSAVLLDEPCSNLDSEGIQWYQEVLAQVFALTTTIVATNDPQKEAPQAKSILEL